MASDTPGSVAPRNFRIAFCECFDCPAEAFVDRLFWKCVHPSLRPLARLVRCLVPRFFSPDLEYLERVGETATWLHMQVLANGIRDDADLNRGLLRKWLRLRISGLRLIRTYEEMSRHRRKSLA